MRLRISSLIGIIAIIYLCFYYTVYAPCAQKNGGESNAEAVAPAVLVPIPQEEPTTELFSMYPEPTTELDMFSDDEPTTQLIDLTEDTIGYSTLAGSFTAGVPAEAGNVRPDNFMVFE